MLDSLRVWFKEVTGQDHVIVEKGDTLWQIAEDGVGDGARWRDLAAANPSKGWTSEKTMIYPGERIELPDSWL
jgi:nucleoid-associated protein YgaU